MSADIVEIQWRFSLSPCQLRDDKGSENLVMKRLYLNPQVKLQLTAGVACFFMFVVVPMAVQLRTSVRSRENDGSTKVQQLVYEKRMALRKMAEEKI